MCCGRTKCDKPKNLKGKAEDCSAAQIRKCHGDAKKHPCVIAAGRRSRKL
jgi:hypothetical protein